MKNTEYVFLRQKQQGLQRFLLEKPFIITFISLFLLVSSDNVWSSFLPALGTIVLIMYFKNTLIHLEEIEQIKTYIKFALEKDTKYIGWESFLEKYNICKNNNETIKHDEIAADDFSDLHDTYKRMSRNYRFNSVLLLAVSILNYISALIQKKFITDMVASNIFEDKATITTVFPLLGFIAVFLLFFMMIIEHDPENRFNKLAPVYNSRKITKLVLSSFTEHNEINHA